MAEERETTPLLSRSRTLSSAPKRPHRESDAPVLEGWGTFVRGAESEAERNDSAHHEAVTGSSKQFKRQHRGTRHGRARRSPTKTSASAQRTMKKRPSTTSLVDRVQIMRRKDEMAHRFRQPRAPLLEPLARTSTNGTVGGNSIDSLNGQASSSTLHYRQDRQIEASASDGSSDSEWQIFYLNDHAGHGPGSPHLSPHRSFRRPQPDTSEHGGRTAGDEHKDLEAGYAHQQRHPDNRSSCWRHRLARILVAKKWWLLCSLLWLICIWLMI